MNPKIIETKSAILEFPQGKARCEVEISKTAYYVTIRPVGWVGSVIEFYKVLSIGRDRAMNALHAVQIAYRDYMAAGNKWNWK